MIKYNTQKITDALLFKVIAKWIQNKWIQAENIQDLAIDNKSFYPTHHVLKRIGLFIATYLAIESSIGFFSLFLFQLADDNFQFLGVIVLAAGLGFYFLTEKMIDEKQLFKQGPDDALLFSAIQLVFMGLLLLVKAEFSQTNVLFGSLILLFITAFAGYRYLNWFYAVIALLLINGIPIQILALLNQQLLFFAALILIPLNIFILKWIFQKDKFENHFFSSCFKYLKFVCCLMMYVSVNLFVIKETASELLGVNQIPIQGLFLALTIITPLLFIVLGLYYKQKFFLHSGLFLLLPTIATVRFYYSVMPIEFALTFGGLALIVIAYFSIKRIQKNDTPFIFEADQDEDLSNAEILLTLQQFGNKNTEIPNDKTFGGGTFGGAGAEGNF